MASPLAFYQHALTNGFVADTAQQHAVQHLQRCFEALQRGDGFVQGVYLFGPVGRGKTWLMDGFYQSLTVPGKRLHFHHFMRWLHQRLFQLSGTAEPLTVIAQELAAEVKVLCFDELFINDIGDAMILGPLLQMLFREGLVLVATSNQAPDGLYHGGFNREQLLPAINDMQQYMQVVNVDGGSDHRLHPGASQQRYWVNNPYALKQCFNQLRNGLVDVAFNRQTITLGNRPLQVVGEAGPIVWCDYSALCEQPFAANDFIELCDRYQAILLGNVPVLYSNALQKTIARGTEDGAELVKAGGRTLPALSKQDDAVRRFIALVDECYDRAVPLFIEAEVPLDMLYPDGALRFAFNRTLSRLKEMQLQRFGQRAY